jgi:hypothetical protein
LPTEIMLGQVVGQHPAIQHLVPVVQLLHIDVLRKIIALPEHLLVGALAC